MHEMAIIQSLWTILEPEFIKSGAKKLTDIRIQIGDYLQVVDEVLQVCFEAFIMDYPYAKGAKLIIEPEATIAQCRVCQCTWPFKDHRYKCPDCGVSNCVMISGKSLSILSFGVDE